MGTLSRYFFRRQIGTIVQFTIGIMLIVLIVDFTEVSGRLPEESKFSTLQTLYLSALHVPTIMQTTFPFIILFASMATLIGLNRKYELVIARSAGVSAWQFLAPLAFASFLVGIVVVGGVNPLAAKTMQLSELQEVVAGLRNRDSLDDDRPPWMRQKTEDGVTIIGAKSAANDGLLLGNATFLQINNDGMITDRLDAKTAKLTPGHWVLDDVRIFRAGAHAEHRDQMQIKTNLKPAFVSESFSDPKTIPFFELSRKMQAARSFGLSADPFAVQYYTLIALPFLLMSMTLIAAVVSLKFARFGQSVSVIVGGVVAGFVLYVVSVLIKAFGSAGTIPPIAAAWIPVVVAMALGVTILLHKEDG
ncbi:MAG: LPS export ABC transporter permease LptG [Pararhizobium sp.]